MEKKELNNIEKVCANYNLKIDKMMDSNLKLNFFQDTTYQEDKEINIKNRIQFYIRLGKFEYKLGKDLYKFSKAEFKEMFETFDWSQETFSSNKSEIKSYLYWCNVEKLCDYKVVRVLEEVMNETLYRKRFYNELFFANFGVLDDIILKRVAANKSVDKDEIQTAKISLYLAWMGIDIQDICHIKNSDINLENKTIYIERTEDNTIIDEDILNEILRYRNSFEYQDVSMLLRTNKYSQLDKSMLSKYVSKYFSKGLHGEKRIQLKRVYWSGIFLKAFEYEQTHQSTLTVPYSNNYKLPYRTLNANDFEILTILFKEKYTSRIKAYKRVNE